MNIDFDLLLELKKLALETSFKIKQDKNNNNLFYLTEPNATIPFATLDYNKEIENARANPTTSTLRECSTIFLRRVREIIGKRIARSEEREDRSRAETSRDEEVVPRDRRLLGFYGSQVWQVGLSSQERIKAEELNKKIEEQYKQSQSYKQQALKAYKQSGVTFTPKNLQNEITSSLNKEDSNNNFNHQENSNNQDNPSKLFSKFKNKLNTIHQNLKNPTNTNSLNDTLEIDKSQDNQESQDSYLKTQYQMKRRRK